jgi:hypothetical protein
MIITLSSPSMKKDIPQNAFKLKVLHDRQHVVNFSFFIFLEKKGKIIKHHKLPFFMLEVSKTNSRTTLESSPGKLTWIGEFVISSLNFKHIVMANCNVLINNQLSLNWFKT